MDGALSGAEAGVVPAGGDSGLKGSSGCRVAGVSGGGRGHSKGWKPVAESRGCCDSDSSKEMVPLLGRRKGRGEKRSDSPCVSSMEPAGLGDGFCFRDDS